MTDSIVRGTIQVAGVETALTQLRAYRAEMTAIGSLRNRIIIDDSDAKRRLAEFRADTARLRAEAYAVKIGADTTEATQAIRALNAETARIRAQATLLKVTADTEPAMIELRRFEAETKRINALTARAKIDVDTTGATAKMDGLLGKVTQFAAAGAGYAAFGLLTRGIGEAADAMIGYTGRLEQARVAYTNLLGSAQAADKFLGDLQRFASTTPFDLADTQRYAQLLLATGTNAHDIIPTLTTLGNAVSAIGGGGETLDRVVVALSQMKNSVHLNAQDMNQLIQAGINGWGLLAQQIGVTVTEARKMAESGQITGGAAAAAIIGQLSQRNIGLMQQQADTFLGRLENFQDNFKQEMSQIGKPLFDELNKGLAGASDAIASPKFQRFAGDMVHDLNQIVAAGEAVAGAIGKIPTPIIEAAIHLAEFAVAMKAASAALAFGKGVLEPLIALTTAETAATAADTVALEANTAAQVANNAARGGAGAAGGGVLGRVGTLGAAALPTAAIAIAIGEGLDAYGRAVTDVIHKQFGDAIKDALIHLPGTPWGAVTTGFDAGMAITGGKGSGTGQAFPTQTLNLPGAGEDAGSQWLKQRGAASVMAGLSEQVKSGAITVDQARASWNALTQTFGALFGDVTALTKAFDTGLDAAVQSNTKSWNDAVSAVEEYRAKIADVQKYRALGVDAETISRGVYGKTGTGADVTDFQKQAAAKALADATAAQSAYLASLEELHRQAAAEIAAAWKSAEQEIGRIDLTKGFSSLAESAAGLHAVRDELARLGQDASALTGITRIADEFKAISDAEDTASASYRAYMGLLSESDARIQKLQALKKAYDDAADAALAAQRAGTATPAQNELVAGRTAVDANIEGQIGRIRRGQAGDLVAAVKVAPDLAGFDDEFRRKVAEEGGAPALAAKVTAETTEAQQRIKDLLTPNPRELRVELKTNIDDVRQDMKGLEDQITSFFGGTPPGWLAQVIGLTGRSLPGAPPTAGQGPGGTAAAVAPPSANPVGWNQYQPLSMPQYQSIVREGSGGRPSPFEDPDIYASVLAAAQKYGVDPRVLLAWTKDESGNGTTSGAALNSINNFGGIQFAGQPGATDAGFAEPGHSKNFAAFNTPQDFFNALAANLSTDQYRPAYDRGDLIGVSKMYAESPGTRVQDYADYATRYPAAQGQGAEFDTARFQQAVGNDDNGAGARMVAAARKHLGEAQQATGQAWYLWCEKFVGNIEDEAGLIAYRAEDPEHHLADARRGVRGAGTIIDPSQRRPGDQAIIVAENHPMLNGVPYEPSAVGHTGVVAEDVNKFYNTAKGGIALSDLPSGTVFIRPDGVVANGPVPGSTATRNPGASAPPAAGQINLTNPNTPEAAAAYAKQNAETKNLLNSITQVDRAQAQLNATFAGMNPKDITAATGEFQKMAPVLEKMALAKLDPAAGADEKLAATNSALAQSLQLTNLWAHALTDIRNGSTDIASVQAKITQIIGGPLAANLNAQLAIMRDQHATASQINLLTERRAALEKAHAAEQAANAAADRAMAREQTRQSWADQDADTARQHARRVAQERDTAAYTAVQRGFEDRSRALQFSQQVGATDLQNRLIDLQKSQQQQGYQRTSQEQLLSRQVEGAGTNQEAAALAARLAGMHDQDLAQRDLNTKAIDDIQLQIREQARAANLESYNLETERIAATRAHEDHLAQVQSAQAAEDEAISASRQARDRAHQEEQWQIEDARAAQDAAYQNAISSIDDEIKKQQELATTEQDALTALQAAWDAFGQSVSADLSNLAAGFSQAAQASTPAPTPDLPGWSPTPIRQLGGAGQAIAPVAPAANAMSGASTTDLHMHFNGGAMALSDADKADIQAFVDGKIAAAERRMSQAGRRRMGALGLN